MERIAERRLDLSFSRLSVSVFSLGDDLAVLLYGGEREHIGSAVLSVPRLSLKDDGTVSCTSSVLNLPGHKDEAICRMVSESLSASLGKTVLAAGGFHVDNLSKEDIKEVIDAVSAVMPSLVSELRIVFQTAP